jgi:hypothetical protein
MSSVYAATKKGLFQITRQNGRWTIARVSFLGDNLSLALPDRRDGTLYAAQDLGHFGVKMQRSKDGGTTRIRRNQKTSSRKITSARYGPGKPSKSGPSNRDWRANPAYSGSAPSLAASFAPPIPARRGNS